MIGASFFRAAAAYIAAGAGAVVRTFLDKLRDRVSVKDYYDGEASWDLAFSRALAAHGEVFVPDGDYGLLAPLQILNDKRLVLSHAATIYAAPGFVGTRLVLIGLADASNSTNRWAIEGGRFHCKQLVDVGIESTRARYGYIRTIVIGARKKGIWMGSSAVGSKGDCDIEPGTEVWWWDNGTAAPAMNAADTIGIHYDKCPDSNIYTPKVIGYRTGIQIDSGSNRLVAAHVWSDTSKNHGPMQTGITVNGNFNSIVSPYLDTPTNVGDATITDCYGMQIGGFCNKVIDFQLYNNGNFNAVDNLVTAINWTVANSQTVVNGFTSQATTNAFKLKAFFAGFWTTANLVTITGMSEDARVYDNTQRLIQFGDRPITFGTALTCKAAVTFDGGVTFTQAPTFNASTVFGQSVTMNGSSKFTGIVQVDKAAGSSRFVDFLSGGLKRAQVGVNNSAEAGADAGSDFAVITFDDAGNFKATPLTVRRSSGQVLIGDGAAGTNVRINTLTTNAVGAAGGASALPATPSGYMWISVNGTDRRIPYYA